jgi:CRP/FNR family transcriptional regulator, cyclic AMP receptor protein
MISPEILRRYPYFAHISDESLKEVAKVAEEVTVPAGKKMFNTGDPANYLYIILRGEVDIQYELGSGELRTVDTLVDGDLLVWSAMVEPYKTTAVGTTTKDTHLAKLSAPRLRELCDRDPQLGYRLTIQIAKLLANRLESARIQLAAVD